MIDITDQFQRHGLCECGKVCFDKKSAQTKRNSLIRRGNARDLRIYQCDRSNYWHLTSKFNDKRIHRNRK